MIAFSQALTDLESAGSLDESTVAPAIEAILSGAWNPTQTAAYAVALRVKGETAGVIAAGAKGLRGHMLPVEHGLPAVLDTCGTGGDGKGSLNISTGAAIIVAACGIPVTKHGNRAVSSKSGSADVLEALGVRIDLPPEDSARILREAGICFLFAPHHHPAMRHVAPARRELGVRTVFNLLGPLANPARATHQLLGAYDDRLRPVLAKTLAELGVERAWVVRSEDGMDEVSPFAPTRVTELSNGKLREFVISPQDFGLELSPDSATDGGDAALNAQLLRGALAGDDHPCVDAFALNAASALCVFHDLAPRDAMERVRTVIREGAALAKLEEWISASNA